MAAILLGDVDAKTPALQLRQELRVLRELLQAERRKLAALKRSAAAADAEMNSAQVFSAWDVLSGKMVAAENDLPLTGKPSADAWTEESGDAPPGSAMAWAEAQRRRAARYAAATPSRGKSFKVERATSEVIFTNPQRYSSDDVQRSRSLSRYEERPDGLVDDRRPVEQAPSV